MAKMPTETDYETLLSNFYTPSPEERTSIEVFCSQEREQIDALDSEIDKQRQKLEDLVAQRDERVRKCAVVETIVTPIRKLPHDLLRDIFILCLPNVATDRLWDGTHSGPPPSAADEERAALALVCRLWSSVVASTPLLWSKITLLSSAASPNISSFVELCIQRSQSCLLDVYVSIYNHDHPAAGHVTSAIPLLVKCMNRIHALSLSVPVESVYMSCLSTLFPRRKSTEMPNLRYFRLMHSTPSWEIYTGNVSNLSEVGLIDCPKLRRLSVTQVFPDILRHLTGDALLTMREVSVVFDHRYPPVPLLTTRLQECLSLRRLSWTETNSLDSALDNGSIQPAGFAFPKLKYLSLRPCGSQSAFKSLHAPCIEEIWYGCSLYTIELDALSQLLPNTKHNLHSLCFSQVSFEDKKLETFCLTAPSLKWLSFSDCTIPSSFFCFLMPKRNADSRLGCPLLATLAIKSGDFCLSSLTALLYMKSMSVETSSSWSPLKQVIIAGDPYNTSPESLAEFQSTFPDIVKLQLDDDFDVGW